MLATRSGVRWILLGAAIVYLPSIVVAFNRSLKAAAARALLEQQIAAALDSAAVWQARYDSVAGVSVRVDTVVHVVRARATEALATVDSARIAAQALSRALTASATVRDSLTASLAIIAAQGAQITALTIAADTLTVALDLMTQDRDRWRQLAQQAPVEQVATALEAARDARACRILGTVKAPCLRLPPGMRSAMLVGAGIVIGAKVAR